MGNVHERKPAGNWKDRVAANVRQQIAAAKANPRDHPGWLQTAKRFDRRLVIGDEAVLCLADGLLNELLAERGCGSYQRDRKVRDLAAVLGNLMANWGRPIRLSMNENAWPAPRGADIRYQEAGSFVPEMVRLLVKSDYLAMVRGFMNDFETKVSRIWPTRTLEHRLIDVLETDRGITVDRGDYRVTGFLPMPGIKEVLELRHRRRKKRVKVGRNKWETRIVGGDLKNYKDSSTTHRMRHAIEHANEVNAAADIRCGGHPVSVMMKAVFVGNFTLYGRLHTWGQRHVQGLASRKRREVTFGGEPAIELDYQALHPSLLYAAQGIQLNEDPYSIVDRRPEVRRYLKTLLLCLLNAADFDEARLAGNNWLYRHRDERENLDELGLFERRQMRIGTRTAADRRRRKIAEEEGVNPSGLTVERSVADCGPMLERMMAAHEPIAGYFCTGSDSGLRFMRKDAAIALDIVSHFTGQGVPCVPVHDSYLVPERYGDELADMMEARYQHHTGGFKCLVKAA